MSEVDIFLYGNRLETDIDDAEWALQINRYITYYCLTPVAAIGMFLNVFVIIIWTKVSSKTLGALYLFKALAVADILYTSGFCLWYFSERGSTQKVIFRAQAFSSRSMVVDINFLMAFVRWSGVRFPVMFQKWTICTMRVALVVFAIYCLSVEATLILMVYLKAPASTLTLTIIVMEQINLSIPLLLQFYLSVFLLRMMRALEKKREKTGQHRNQDADRILKGRNRRLTASIVCINVMTLIAYPVGISVITYFKLVPAETKTSFKRIVFACINLLQVTNSSVGFIVYMFFVPEFRHVAKRIFCQGGWKEICISSRRIVSIDLFDPAYTRVTERAFASRSPNTVQPSTQLHALTTSSKVTTTDVTTRADPGEAEVIINGEEQMQTHTETPDP